MTIRKKLTIKEKLNKFPPPWSVKYHDLQGLYIISDTKGRTVTQTWDPQDAKEILEYGK